MRPESRIQAVIELLTEVDSGGRPADGAASAYFRERRYIGAKDRRAVADQVWGILRRHARLTWWLRWAAQRGASGGDAGFFFRDPATTARALTLADLMVMEGKSATDVAQLCAGGPHDPKRLNPTETDLVRALEGRTLEHPDMPDWVKGECPEWLTERLSGLFGASLVRELAALNEPATVDLRVNALKGTRADALAALKVEGIAAEPSKLSPLGMRLTSRVNLPGVSAFVSGLIEVQDESSQLAALLADARPGMNVVDFCAGAGGKTLALAAAMNNKGRLIACDVSQGRLDRSKTRLKRAGVFNVTPRCLSDENDKWVKRKAGSFDRVFLDAPCSGTGTWRRNPDAKWRLTLDGVAELTAKQAKILDSAWRLAAPGGWLIYATCSLLPEENEGQIEAFLSKKTDARLLPVGEIWDRVIAAKGGAKYPLGEAPMLRLTPAKNGTDGFFVAVMEKLKDDNRQTP